MDPNRKDSQREFWTSARRNNRAYQRYFNRLMDLALNRFEWMNLPDTVDERFLELALVTDGQALFFNDDALGYLGMRCIAAGKWDNYNIPQEREAYAANSYRARRTAENSVLIYNNRLHMNDYLAIEEYACRLYEIERTIDVNIAQQKTPKIICSTPQQRLTMKNLFKAYEGNEPFIFADKNIDLKAIQILDNTSPQVFIQLQEQKNNIWNEALTWLGYPNVSFQKKERLITDEVSRSMGGTIASRFSGLTSRQEACDEINRMFGLNISVDFRTTGFEEYNTGTELEETENG